jgi:adenylate kinase family enzyme
MHIDHVKMKGAVLLLGAPGVGKSVLGDALCAAHGATVHAFLNVGEQWRKAGKVDTHLRHPTAAGKEELQQLARNMLSAACQELAEANQATDHTG